MSYENAPATKLLATHCIICGKELVDAVSVEAGIGPTCREKHGYMIDADESVRAQVNKLVHHAAARAGLAARTKEDLEFVFTTATQIEALGYTLLAKKIRERFVAIVLTENGTHVEAVTPYSEAFLGALKRDVFYQDRRWNKEKKCWEVKVSAKVQLLKALATAYPGKPALGSKGVFMIPTLAEFEEKWV
jgi:hypothetical protein